jgi:hypothetical protein
VTDASEDDLYAAMDWLLQRQNIIEKKLAAQHLSAGGLVLYDLSSSYFEGTTCPLAKRGYNRDGKHGMLQVNYGLLTDARPMRRESFHAELRGAIRAAHRNLTRRRGSPEWVAPVPAAQPSPCSPRGFDGLTAHSYPNAAG